MRKTMIYFPDEDLDRLHRLSRETGRSVADLVREAVRTVWLRTEGKGPVNIWNGPCARTSIDHDSIYDDASS